MQVLRWIGSSRVEGCGYKAPKQSQYLLAPGTVGGCHSRESGNPEIINIEVEDPASFDGSKIRHLFDGIRRLLTESIIN